MAEEGEGANGLPLPEDAPLSKELPLSEGLPLSEHGLIARYFAPLAKDFPGAYGLLDDAAVIEAPAGTDLVVTMDALVAGVHFFADDAPADIAWKALAVNVSDLAAKGATPLAYSLALTLPPPPSAEFLGGFASGLAEAQARFGIALSGGDTTRGPLIVICVTAFGTVPRGKAVRRGGAQPDDSLYVTGTIGDAALGLKLRSGDSDALAWLLAEDALSWLVQRYLRPEPRTAFASALLAHASAAMDISDGLAIDCGRLCATSGVAAAVDASAIPLSLAASAVIAAHPHLIRTALTGGDDYEILFAVRAGQEQALEQAASAAGVRVTRIGALAAGEPILTIRGSDGGALDLGSGGFDHFLR